MNKITHTLKEINLMLSQAKGEYEALQLEMKEAIDDGDVYKLKNLFTKLENIKRSIDHMENYEFHIDWSQR